MKADLGRKLRAVRIFEQLGPGLVTGAADDDPSGIATYSQAGASFGFTLLWTLVLTYPLMSAVQLVSAHIGRVTGEGLAHNMRKILGRPVVLFMVALLFIANTINIGADIAAMAEAVELVTGLNGHVLTVLIAFGSLLLQLFMPYHHYARVLKWLTLSLFSYVALVFMLRLDWHEVGLGLVWPRIPGSDAVTMIVALFGTTISPYLFFWQSAQEVEEIEQHDEAQPLIVTPSEASREFRRMRFDTFLGMAISNLVALAIMIGTAATLHSKGITEINTAADAAKALEPIAGKFASLLFCVGIIGTGLLAVPVLAGSVAYAVSDTQGWKRGLEHKPQDAAGFYAVIGVATLLGILIDWSPLDPIKALFWSAVINGVVAVPIMAAMMAIASYHRAMGQFTAKPALLFFGWGATLVMAAAAISMAIWP